MSEARANTVRQVRCAVSVHMLAEMLDLPHDVAITDARMDWNADAVEFRMASEAFPELRIGDVIPLITPTYHRPHVGGAHLSELPTYGKDVGRGIVGVRRMSDRAREEWEQPSLSFSDVRAVERCIEEVYGVDDEAGRTLKMRLIAALNEARISPA